MTKEIPSKYALTDRPESYFIKQKSLTKTNDYVKRKRIKRHTD